MVVAVGSGIGKDVSDGFFSAADVRRLNGRAADVEKFGCLSVKLGDSGGGGLGEHGFAAAGRSPKQYALRRNKAIMLVKALMGEGSFYCVKEGLLRLVIADNVGPVYVRLDFDEILLDGFAGSG